MRKSVKQFLSIFAATTLLAGVLAGCGDQPSNPSASETGSSSTESGAQLDYPTKNIDLVVTFAAGGGNDVLARAVAGSINLPTTMTVTNIEGGSGTIGAMEVVNADPDGYTLLLHSGESLISQYCSGVVSEPIHEELTLVANLAYDYEALLISSANKNFSSLEEFIDYAKANPGKVNIAGAGSRGRIEAVALDIIDALGIDANYVSYDSGAKCRTAVMGGHVDAVFTQIASEVGYIESGELVPLAVTAEERVPVLGDTCVTFKEMGYDIISGMTRSIWAPKETPQEILDYLSNQIEVLFNDQTFLDTLEGQLHYNAAYLGAADAKAYYADMTPEIERIMQNMLNR